MPTDAAIGVDGNSGVVQKPLRAVVAGALPGGANHCTVSQTVGDSNPGA